MSFFQTLGMSLFNDNVCCTSITIDNVNHTIPIDTILHIPRTVRIANMILHYCAFKDEQPEMASRIFQSRNGKLFSYILHFADTRHLVYPSDLELTKTLVRDLCRYGLITIKEGYCLQCLMEYFKLNGLDDFRKDVSDTSTYPFLHIIQETIIIQTEDASGNQIFVLRVWGNPETLEELFPKGQIVNDSTYFHLSMCVTVIHTDACGFLRQIGNIICVLVNRLGFRATSHCSWFDESKAVQYGQCLLYREVPAVVSSDTNTTTPRDEPVIDRSPTSFTHVQELHPPKAKKRWCPRFTKKYREDTSCPMTYPELPAKKDAPTKPPVGEITR